MALIRLSAEIDGVSDHEGPVAIKNERFEFPIPLSLQMPPNNVRRLPVTPIVSEFHKLGAEAFVDQELHFAFLRRGRR
jgi:hypothetical protein